jgi:hypothetical protein
LDGSIALLDLLKYVNGAWQIKVLKVSESHHRSHSYCNRQLGGTRCFHHSVESGMNNGQANAVVVMV